MFGRKTILVYGSILVAMSGVTRSFSVNYAMLATLELFDGLIIGSLYDPSFLLGMESLSPSKRLLGTMIITVYYAMGQVVLACLIWFTKDWRLLQRYFYAPMLVAVSLHWWLLTESVRWLYTNKRFDEMLAVVKKMARMNKTEELLPNIINKIKNEEAKEKDGIATRMNQPNESKTTGNAPFLKAIKSRIIMTRFAICTISRILCLFTYYGLSQYAIESNSNRYLSFLLVSLAELPGYIASIWVPGVTILGRRGAAAVSFFIMGIICLALYFINHDFQTLTLSLSLVAKFSSTLAMTVIYLYTAELFPTEARHTLISASVTLGSLGFIAAQQFPLFERYIDSVLVYGMCSMAGATVILIGPETMNIKLPDTIQEAETIGRRVNQLNTLNDCNSTSVLTEQPDTIQEPETIGSQETNRASK